MSFVSTVATQEGSIVSGSTTHYYVKFQFTSQILGILPTQLPTLQITLTDRFTDNTLQLNPPFYVAYDVELGSQCLIAYFTMDVIEYATVAWSLSNTQGMVFADGSGFEGAGSGEIPYNYNLPLFAGEIQMFFAGSLLEINYTVPYSGGLVPYQSWEFTLFTFPDYNVITYQSQLFDFLEVDRSWLLANYPGQQIIASAQVVDATWTYSDTAYSNVLMLPSPSLSRAVMGLGLALGTP
jgi:hypothetical protein